MSQYELIQKTFDLLEDLAKNGIIKVTINRPPSEHAKCTLPGIYALIPNKKQKFSSYPSDLLWRLFDHDNHGGMLCGNGMGYTPDKKWYWCQAQTKMKFFTGTYEWLGQDTNSYRSWYSPEVTAAILGT